MSTFQNQWIEIFRAGDYGAKGNWPPEKLALAVANFKTGVWKPPAVLGHPQEDSPAHGWVEDLRLHRDVLEAKFEKATPQFEALVRDGRFPNRSTAFYLDPEGKGPVVRHVGFLGAVPPEVKGLAPIQFSGGEFVAIEFNEEDDVDPKDIASAVDTSVRNFFKRLFGEEKPAAATFTQEDVKKLVEEGNKVALDELKALRKEFSDGVKKADERASTAEAAARGTRFDAFIEGQRTAGKWVPAFDAHLPALRKLAIEGGSVEFTEGEGEKAKTVKVDSLDAMLKFLEAQAAIVPLGELGAQAQRNTNVIEMRFNETRDLKVDPESVTLNAHAEAIAAELRKQDPKLTELAAFKEGLKRASAGVGRTAAGGIAAGKA